MFSPRGFIKKFQNRKKNTENDNETRAAKRTKMHKTIKYDSDESVRAALLEILIYIVFLVVTTMVANAAHHLYMFYFNQTLERSFLGRTSQTKFGSEVSFEQLVTTADWWIFLETNFLDDLHAVDYEPSHTAGAVDNNEGDEDNESDQGNELEEDIEKKEDNKEVEENDVELERELKNGLAKKYNKATTRTLDKLIEEKSFRNSTAKGNIEKETQEKIGKRSGVNIKEKDANDKLQRLYLRDNLLLGPPRLRQIRVNENSCQVHKVFFTYFKSCYAGYSKDIENHTEIYKETKFYTMSELKVNRINAEITTYYGAGYVQNLTFNREENQNILKLLKESQWIDRGTRIVILEFVLFNVNAFMFNNVKIIAEITPVGGIVPSHQFQALKFHSIWTEGDLGLYIAGGIFYTMVVFYTIEEITQYMRIGGREYFISAWNILDLMVLILSYLSLVYSIIHPLYLQDIRNSAEANPDEFISIDYICYWNLMYIDMMGICVFLVWIKIFKYISFNKTMLQFSLTLKRCAKDLFGFAVMFFIVFLAYAQLGLLIFGTSHPDFREFGISVITLMRMFLGDFEYQLIEEANHILGPIYFLTYVLFVFFILLNMFLAIINDTYGAVKSEVQKGHSNFGSYLAKVLRNVFSYCFHKKKADHETNDITEIMNNAAKANDDITPNTSSSLHPSTTQPSSLYRVRKRESEVLREYFEELPENEQSIPPHQFLKENSDLKLLNNRITLLEEVLEQLIANMDRILKMVESKKTKST